MTETERERGASAKPANPEKSVGKRKANRVIQHSYII